MKKSTKALIAVVVVLNGLIAAWGLLEPSQRDFRMPVWAVLLLLIGAVTDRFISKRA